MIFYKNELVGIIIEELQHHPNNYWGMMPDEKIYRWYLGVLHPGLTLACPD